MEYTIGTMKALIVDDEPSVARAISKLLSRRGYSCRTAGDAATGLRTLQEEKFDLVVSDLRMPGRNGIEFLSDVVASHPDTATVILTGFGDGISEEQAHRAGVDAFMTKKADQAEIEICLERALINKTIRLAAAVA